MTNTSYIFIHFSFYKQSDFDSLIEAFGKNNAWEQIHDELTYFDYLYCAADLVLLKGKKYNGQRNLISQFKRSVDAWSFEMIDSNSINRVKDFFL